MRKYSLLILLLLQACTFRSDYKPTVIDIDNSKTSDLIHHIPVLEIPRVGTVKASNGVCKLSEDGPFNLVQASAGNTIRHHSRLVVEQGCTVLIDFGDGLIIDIQNADHGSDVVFYINSVP